MPRIPAVAGAVGRYVRYGCGTGVKPVKERREILAILAGVDVEHNCQIRASLSRGVSPVNSPRRVRVFDLYVS
jgi:hypothetical protein